MSTSKLEVEKACVDLKMIKPHLEKKEFHIMNYLLAMFNFGFFTFMIPFRIVSTKTGFILKSNKIQKGVYTFLQLLILFETSSWILCILRHDLLKTPSDILNLAHVTGCLSFRLICIYFFSRRKQSFRKLLKKIGELEYLLQNEFQEQSFWNKFQDVMIPYVIFGLGFVGSIIELIAVNTGISRQGFMGGILHHLITETRILYQFEEMHPNATMHNHQLTNLCQVTPFTIIFSFVHFIGILPHYFCLVSLDKNVLVLVYFARRLIQQFNFYVDLPKTDINRIFSEYLSLKSVFTSFNDAFGIFFLLLICGCLPFYPTWAGIACFQGSKVNYYQLIQFVIFFTTLMLILHKAASIVTMVEDFYEKMSNRYLMSGEEVIGQKLPAILIDLQTNRLSLRGGNMFTFTYPFFRTVLSIIVTYTIIVVQFHQPWTSHE